MLISKFSKRKDNKRENLKNTAKILGGGYLTVQGTRSGLGRSLGVRLESHSTGNRQARKILKSGGYLNPDNYGEGAAQTLKFLGLTEKDAASKGKAFITGMHPDEVAKYRNTPIGLGDIAGQQRAILANNPLAQRQHVKLQRKGYRLQGAMSPEAMQAQLNVKKKMVNGIPLDAEDYINQLKLTMKVPGSSLRGKSLYVGGSDDFYRQNFIPDPDDIAMATSKKLKVHGNRLGAITEAIKREGLGNLLKKSPKSRLAVGIGLLGAAGLGTGMAIDGARKIKRKYTKKNKPYWNRFK